MNYDCMPEAPHMESTEPENTPPLQPEETIFERLSVPLVDVISSAEEDDKSESVDALFEATPESNDTDVVVIEDED